jgi:hypothetical protein
MSVMSALIDWSLAMPTLVPPTQASPFAHRRRVTEVLE